MATDFTIASLCAGGGGLERAIGLCVESARVVVYVEREAFACEVLATAHEQVGVGDAVLWPDLLTFDGRPWRGVIDCVAAGIPCQPHSVAGKRLGAADERNLWPATQRVIREVEPPFVFLENVGGSVPFFGEHVVCGLEGMGYRVEAGLFEAAEVGASHRRQRLFVLAQLVNAYGGVLHRERGATERQQAGDASRDESAAPSNAMATGGDVADASHPDSPRKRRKRDDVSGAANETLADAERAEPGAGDASEQGQSAGYGRHRPTDRGPRLADTDASRSNQDERPASQRRPDVMARNARLADADKPRREGWGLCRSKCADERTSWACSSEVPLFPPGPDDRDAWATVLAERPDLAPATQCELRRVADGVAGRADRLRLLGNGVVDLQGAYAFCALLSRLRGRLT